ncbi:endonuclease/exonuclease/phosphatase family protein [Nocardioides sp. CER19]|uniref:endonuclease/exonuclease/phosphatase family protein n=1 Tax=Nocardioides sp. CER19 TaxID=3038538 RepID=UPI0024496AE0|nr:endonuclease/exonuclease/phosphatase family protein [Nocardioides sp. CER19]MDH2414325.1 hypothetical protein [Nocardioides sp. CER19]
MRIGTWNLAGRWSDGHQHFLEALDCDVLLLTEVSDRVTLPSSVGHVTEALMAPRRYWSGIWSRRGIKPLPDPHDATAMAEVMGLRVCSSILPWKGCGARTPWVGVNTYERTANAVDVIERAAPAIWGGDWNHALRDREYSGSKAGRHHIAAAMEHLGLRAPTADAPHQIDGLHSIDHVAVPASWQTRVEHHTALLSEGRLSDHDAYVLEVIAQ